MPFRALIKTHHMTSRKKIQTLSKAAKTYSCAVVFKTSRPPGVMIAEAEDEDALGQWVDTVKVPLSKGLRYKFYDLLWLGEAEKGKLGEGPGHVKEVTEMKELSKYLDECEMLPWWTENMKFL